MCNSRRLLACLGALAVSSLAQWVAAVDVRAWAAPTLGQHVAATNVSTTTTLSPTSLTTGSTNVVGVSQTSSDIDQSYSVSGSVNGAYTSIVLSSNTGGASSNRKCQLFYFKNAQNTAGAEVVTVTSANGSVTNRSQFVEIQGASASAPLDVFDSVAEAADTTTHTASAGLTTAADVFVYMVGALNNTSTFTPTASPAFTTLAGDFDSTASLSQYYTNATGLSANAVTYTGGTGRTAASCVASFVATAAGGPPTNSLSLLGVGK